MLTLVVNGKDYSEYASGIQHSSVDPGGWEVMSFDLPYILSDLPTIGAEAVLYDGLQIVFEGRVEEPGEDARDRATTYSVQCVGAGAVLKDTSYAMIYVDRDLSAWTPISQTRQLLLANATRPYFPPEVIPDTQSGQQALRVGLRGPWAVGTATAEAMYDAGPNCTLAAIYFRWSKPTIVDHASVNWAWGVDSWTNDTITSSVSASANLRAAGPSRSSLALGSTSRVVRLYAQYATSGGVNGLDYSIYWQPVVYGTHGLPVVGSGTDINVFGLRHYDIARHAAQQAGVSIGLVEVDDTYTVLQSAYKERVHPEQVIDDMSKHSGWHWGVWSNRSGFAGDPEFFYVSPPESATVFAHIDDCDTSRFSQRLSEMHDSIHVSWSEVNGTRGSVTVTRDNPRSPITRSTSIDIGISSSTVAQAYGAMFLALEEQQARAAGSIVISGDIRTTRGLVPVNHLRAGLDRIQIAGLPNSGPWTESDTRRFDTFRIKRINVTYRGGKPTATLELDAGMNLIEVMQARFENAVPTGPLLGED
jgi:hypothetical protein